MKKNSFTAILLVTLLAASGCTNNGNYRQAAGGIIGAAAGGILGAQIGSGTGQVAAAAIGAGIGALVGSEIGRGLDEQERAMQYQAMNRAIYAPTGQTQRWGNPQGNYGYVTPTTNPYQYSGRTCRNAQLEAYIDGQKHLVNKRVCKAPNGQWEAI